MISANASEVSQYKAQALPGSHSEATFWRRINAGVIGSLFRLPLDAWSRVLALFLGLAGVKTLLLLQFGKQLYDVHWRIGGTDQAWWDYVNFGVFVTLGVVSLLRLGRHCESIGRRAVRSANAVILASGFIFIFLTFHVSNKNYLYPIFSGVLKWGALGPYLSLDFFFHQPYLAGWMFVYAAIYYVLARPGRESRTLYVTAVFAGAYALLNLRELAFLRPELILLNCLGLASVACGWRAGQGSSFWWLVPAAWAIPFIWQLFQRAPAGLFLSYGYFAGLAGVGAVVLGTGTLLARVRGFSSIWLKFVFFYFSGFLLLANNNYPMSANFNHALCLEK